MEAYRSLNNRVRSFLSNDWPHSEPSPFDVAAAGFFYIGPYDKVRCFECRIRVSHWQGQKNAWVMHESRSPSCSFLRSHFLMLPRPLSSLENFSSLEVRMQTFARWPHRGVDPEPEQLAYAGFYYLGVNDRVKCFACGATCESWEPGDSQWRKHHDAAPHCAYFRFFVNINRLSVASFGGYHTVEGRLLSFHDWPKDKTQLPTQLAHAGFVYMGKGDSVYCFMCKGELKNWKPKQDPFKRHLRKFRYCDHANLGFSNEGPIPALTDFCATVPTTTTTEAVRVVPSAPPAPECDKAVVLDERRLCQICMDADIASVFVPCGHMFACNFCSTGLDACPICRTPIETSVRAYLP